MKQFVRAFFWEKNRDFIRNFWQIPSISIAKPDKVACDSGKVEKEVVGGVFS